MKQASNIEKGISRAKMMQFLGWGSELVAWLLLTIYVGWKLDKKLAWGVPLFIWLFPILAIFYMLYKLYMQTTKSEENE